MAELRKAEETIASLTLSYRAIQQDARSQGKLSPLTTTASDIILSSSANDDDATNSEEATRSSSSFTEYWTKLRTLAQKVQEMNVVVDKFRQRMKETDPVTGNPRYGAKTQTRVTNLLTIHEELTQHLQAVVDSINDSDSSPEDASPSDEASSSSEWIQQLQLHVQQEAQTAEHQKQQAEATAREQKAQVQRQQEEVARAAEQARLDALADEERQRQVRYQQQQDALAAERQAQEEAARADRAWVASIPKGSIQEQLQSLLTSTQSDSLAQRTAVEALHRIFSQICARPEEVNFRRIRRNHPQFWQDIGRHAGGSEFLIAAGFGLGEIDGVSSYICKEPNLETDMDGWSAWFDLLKATLQLLEDQLIKL